MHGVAPFGQGLFDTGDTGAADSGETGDRYRPSTSADWARVFAD